MTLRDWEFPRLLEQVVKDATWYGGQRSFVSRLLHSAAFEEIVRRATHRANDDTLQQLIAHIQTNKATENRADVLNTWSRLLHGIVQGGDGHDDASPKESLARAVTLACSFLKERKK